MFFYVESRACWFFVLVFLLSLWHHSLPLKSGLPIAKRMRTRAHTRTSTHSYTYTPLNQRLCEIVAYVFTVQHPATLLACASRKQCSDGEGITCQRTRHG